MPFQSEKQRRYLWANEPEIARDWTDTYGSGIAKALGGRIPFATGSSYDRLTLEQLKEKLKETSQDSPEYNVVQDAFNKKAKAARTERWGEKVEKAGDTYSNIFADNWETKEDIKQSQDFMGMMEYFKHRKNNDEFNTQMEIENIRQGDPEDFKTKYGIENYKDLKKAVETGYDEAKGTIEFDPNNVQINKASMIPDNFIEQIKSLWGGEPPTPEGIMKAGGYPQETMANWSELDDREAQNIDARRDMELRRLANTMEQYPAPDEGKENRFRSLMSNQKWPNWSDASGKLSGIYQALKGSVPWSWGTQLLSSLTGRNRGPVINPSTQRFMQNYNVGRNQQTGRMVGGPFAGRNLPGTSMFGSKNPKEMAQNWMKKYGDMQYQTRKQQLKQQQIKNIATMNQGPAGITPQAPTRPVHSGQPTGGHHEGGGGGIGSTASRQGPAGGSVGASRFRSRGGRLYNTGGLAGLWPR